MAAKPSGHAGALMLSGLLAALAGTWEGAQAIESCGCGRIPQARSTAEGGICKAIETADPTCTLEWSAIRQDQAPETLKRAEDFLQRAEAGLFGPIRVDDAIRPPSRSALREVIGRADERLLSEPSHHWAVFYLTAVPPGEVEPEPLTLSLLTLLGPAIERAGDPQTAGLVARALLEAAEAVTAAFRSERREPPREFLRQLDHEGRLLRTWAVPGCVEVEVVETPVPGVALVMLKTPRHGGRERCR